MDGEKKRENLYGRERKRERVKEKCTNARERERIN